MENWPFRRVAGRELFRRFLDQFPHGLRQGQLALHQPCGGGSPRVRPLDLGSGVFDSRKVAFADSRPIVEPKAASIRLLLWNLQPLLSPEPLDPLHVHCPAGHTQQRRNASVAYWFKVRFNPLLQDTISSTTHMDDRSLIRPNGYIEIRLTLGHSFDKSLGLGRPPYARPQSKHLS